MHSSVLACLLLLLLASRARADFADLESSAAVEFDDGRVVGGYETSIHEHPYQVSLRYKGGHRCGGAIIAAEWILTAAHCVRSLSRLLLSVKAGSSTLRGRDGQLSRVQDVIIHEDYSSRSSDNDIALLQLARPLELGSAVGTIELGESEGGEALVVGWGALESDGSISNELREVPVPLISNRECSRLYSRRAITARMLCAGYVEEGGRDACQGDSGGPLVQRGVLIGIVSWGYGCAKPFYPGVYTRIAAFRSWISDNAGV